MSDVSVARARSTLSEVIATAQDEAVFIEKRGKLALLAEDPRPPGARALQGRPGLRVRVGNYRIIYMARDDVLSVVVVT